MAMREALRTERLSLRLLDPDDLDVVHSLFSSPGHTIGDGPVCDRAVTLAWLEGLGGMRTGRRLCSA